MPNNHHYHHNNYNNHNHYDNNYHDYYNNNHDNYDYNNNHYDNNYYPAFMLFLYNLFELYLSYICNMRLGRSIFFKLCCWLFFFLPIRV